MFIYPISVDETSPIEVAVGKTTVPVNVGLAFGAKYVISLAKESSTVTKSEISLAKESVITLVAADAGKSSVSVRLIKSWSVS